MLFSPPEIETNGQSNESVSSPDGPSAPPRKVSFLHGFFKNLFLFSIFSYRFSTKAFMERTS